MKTESSVVKTPKAKADMKKAAKSFISSNMVTIMFVALSLLGFYVSGMSANLYVSDIIARVSRNTFLVLSLIIPVVAGMGLNFSIVIGAMAAQGAIIFVTHWGVGGFGGIMLCIALATPVSIILGYMVGKLFNRAKGQEMITGLILGFFAAGWYQFFFLQLVGTRFVPMNNERLVLSQGVGIRTTIDLAGGLRYGLDDLFRMPLPYVLILAAVIGIGYALIRYRKTRREEMGKSQLAFTGSFCLAGIIWAVILLMGDSDISRISVPMATLFFIIALCFFLTFFSRTKLGQDMRTVGQDRHVAAVAGIAVDQVRVTAIILSTVLASWGHIIFLQNMGAFSTYGSYEQIGLYSVAAILIGGATVSKATIGQALLGVFLFHTLFIVSPSAGRQLFGDAQVGEYFRVFVAYGVICVALAMHAWKRHLQAKQG